MKCEVCHRSPPQDLVTLHRVNEFGVVGIWRCDAHLTDEQRSGLDPKVIAITKAIADSAFREWWNRLLVAGDAAGFPINKGDPESYRDYFDEGSSPEDTIRTEMSYCD